VNKWVVLKPSRNTPVRYMSWGRRCDNFKGGAAKKRGDKRKKTDPFATGALASAAELKLLTLELFNDAKRAGRGGAIGRGKNCRKKTLDFDKNQSQLII